MSVCPYGNILDPDFYVTGNHQVKLQELRKQAGGPIVKIEDPLTGVPYWAVMGREEADFIGKHPLIFSSEEKTAVPTEFDEETIAMQSQMLVNMDPPKHQKYRQIGRNAFTPKAVETYHETFTRYAKEIVDTVAAKGQCEFVYDVASELPLMAILDLCGVPKEDRKKIFGWTNQMMFMDDADMSGDNPDLIPDACEEMLRYNAAFAGMRRTLKEDIELAGQQLKKGDKLILH